MRNEMICDTPIAMKSRTLPNSTVTWVHEVLEPDQLSKAKQRFGRQVLNRQTLFLLWGLRVYVFLMVLLIGLQVWNALHV